jgi:4-azaleucine resistance transporter AzlC
MPHSLISIAFKATMPVMFGYVPLGMAFGVLFQDLGYPWYFAPLMGVIVFAGAAQFMAVGLLSAQAGLTEVAISTFLLNSRHMFFGLSLLKRYTARGLKKFYLIFGLTDETYSLITSTDTPADVDSVSYYMAITAFNQIYWVIGCALGAGLGAWLVFDTSGMDFALTALFVVLVIEQWKKVGEPWPFVLALISAVLALVLFRQHMLVTSIALSMIVLAYQAYRAGLRHE